MAVLHAVWEGIKDLVTVVVLAAIIVGLICVVGFDRDKGNPFE